MPRKKIEIYDAREKKKGYLDFGHAVFNDGEEAYNPKNSNYMWGFREGKVSKWEETPECRGHANCDDWRGQTWMYSGRYDAKLKTISCVTCSSGLSSFKRISQSLVSQLEQIFPKAKKIALLY